MQSSEPSLGHQPQQLLEELTEMRDKQLSKFSDTDLRNRLKNKWTTELLDFMTRIVDCQNRHDQSLRPQPEQLFEASNSQIDMFPAAYQGGPEPARPGQQREDAAIQVTPPPPTVSAMQNLKIDLSNVCQSDASLSYTTNGERVFRQRVRFQHRPAKTPTGFFSEEQPISSIRCAADIPAVHHSPRQRCANLSKKKVADRPNSPLASWSSSDDSPRSPPKTRQDEAMLRSRKSPNKTISPVRPFRRSSSSDQWAVVNVSQRRSPSGEKETKMAIMRVDTEQPCEVSKFPVGGVLIFNTSVFDDDDGKDN